MQSITQAGNEDFANSSLDTSISLLPTGSSERTMGRSNNQALLSSNFRASRSSLNLSKADGVFTVGTEGQVSFDYLYQKKAYRGEFGIFSLSGFEPYELGSSDFVQEAIKRVLSNSILGHIVISDGQDDGRFRGNLSWESNSSNRDYLGAKTFAMLAEDKFGIVFVPNGTFEQASTNKGQLDKQPLFSLSSANPGRSKQFADATGSGTVFAVEDVQLDTNSDRDYNDFIFQVRGATGTAPPIAELIASSLDWRDYDIGRTILSYARAYTAVNDSSVGEVVPQELLSSLNKVDLTPLNGKAPLPTNGIADIQSFTNELLQKAQGSLLTLEFNTNQLFDKTAAKIDEFESSFNFRLSDARAKLISEQNDTNQLLEGNKVQVGGFLNDIGAKLIITQDASDTAKPAVIASLGEFDGWLQDIDDQLNKSNNVLPGLREDFNNIYRPSFERLRTRANDEFTGVSTLLEIFRSGASTISTEALETYEKLTTDSNADFNKAQEQYQKLQNDTIDTAKLYRQQLHRIQDSWKQWVDDTEVMLGAWAKILSLDYRKYVESLNNSTEIKLPLIGIIDVGFRADDPDIDYSRIRLGKDWVSKDNNPYLEPSESDQHGTQMLEIIAATRNNNIGINGLNDRSPVWLGRGVGSGSWAQSLIEFVDTVKASKRQNAIVDLSFELTQTNPDGSFSPRYELTALEQAALTYAQQNQVLIVAAAGNDGKAVSALGQASLKFDNILVAGAAERWQAASYSNFGQGLDILASGNTASDRGTSIAAAKVTGAASLVWMANPRLNYSQVINILKLTATDLNSVGWDDKTGAGLLNISASIYLAKVTMPEPYLPLGFKGLQTVIEAHDIPQEAQSKLYQMYYYFDLESKLTGERWKSTDGSIATERSSGLLDWAKCTFSTLVGGVVGYSILGLFGGAAGALAGEKLGCGDTRTETLRKIDEATRIEGAKKVGDFQKKFDDALLNYQNTTNAGFQELEEARKNGVTPEKLQELQGKVDKARSDALQNLGRSAEDFLKAKQDVALAIADADAKLKQAEEEFGSSENIFHQLGTKVLGTIERSASWVANLPANTVRLGENLWNGFKSIHPWSVDWWKTLGHGQTWGDFLEWVGKNGVLLTELSGVNLVAETAADFANFRTRPLTDREITVAKSVFGDNINYSLIRIDERSVFSEARGNGPNPAKYPTAGAFTTFHTINSSGPMQDATLIHELTHIKQYEMSGPAYIPEALAENEYAYGTTDDLVRNQRRVQSYNVMKLYGKEQQAAIVEDYFRIRQTGKAQWNKTAQKVDLSAYAYHVAYFSEYDDIYLAFYAK